jgi:hypothetical protein
MVRCQWADGLRLQAISAAHAISPVPAIKAMTTKTIS